MSGDDQNDDERSVAPLPLAPPMGPPVDGVLDLGHAPDVQRLESGSHDPQRLGSERVDAQRGNPNVDAQRRNPAEHASDSQRVEPMEHAADGQRAASDVRKAAGVSRARSFRRLRLRTRFLMASAAVVAAGGGTVLIVSAQDDDTPAGAPTTSVVITAATTDPPAVITEPSAVVTTDAPSTVETTVLETTIAPTTLVGTTLVETTLIPTTLAPTLAGLYSVTVTDVVFTTSLTGADPLPQQPADEWRLEGACDGIGTCTMSLRASSLGGGPTADSMLVVVMSPSGPGTYSGTVDLSAQAPGCASATGEFSITYGPGAYSGTYLATFVGSGDCPSFTVSANYSGTLTG